MGFLDVLAANKFFFQTATKTNLTCMFASKHYLWRPKVSILRRVVPVVVEAPLLIASDIIHRREVAQQLIKIRLNFSSYRVFLRSSGKSRVLNCWTFLRLCSEVNVTIIYASEGKPPILFQQLSTFTSALPLLLNGIRQPLQPICEFPVVKGFDSL